MADRQDEPQDGALPVTGAFAPIRLPEEWREPPSGTRGHGGPAPGEPSPGGTARGRPPAGGASPGHSRTGGAAAGRPSTGAVSPGRAGPGAATPGTGVPGGPPAGSPGTPPAGTASPGTPPAGIPPAGTASPGAGALGADPLGGGRPPFDVPAGEGRRAGPSLEDDSFLGSYLETGFPRETGGDPEPGRDPELGTRRERRSRRDAGSRRGADPADGPSEISPARVKAAKRKRRVVVLSAFLSTVVLLLAGVFWGGLGLFSGNVERVANPETVAAAPDGPLNILIAGVDDVKGLSKRERDLLSLNGERSGNRTDTLMVMRLSSDHKRVTVVSIPRDTWVDIPGHGQNKINAAYAFGGPKTTTKVIKRLTGLPINHYVEVNPMGLVKIIDRLGGINMCVPSTITDPKINFTLEKGTKRHLGGIAASKFARTRVVGNDFGRMKRQQKVISATLKKALSSETLTSPARLAGFVTEAARAVKVDDSLSNTNLIGLADQLKNIELDQVQFTSLPVANPDYRPYADSEDENLQPVSAVQHDAAATRQLFNALKADRPLIETEDESESEDGPKLAPSDVKVRVLNGGGVTGMGAQAKEDVEELGFKVPKEAGDTNPANHKETFVRYTEGHEEEAKLLAAKFPDATTKLVPRGAPVTLIVGKSYDGPKEAGPPKDIEASTAKDNTKAVDCRKVAS